MILRPGFRFVGSIHHPTTSVTIIRLATTNGSAFPDNLNNRLKIRANPKDAVVSAYTQIKQHYDDFTGTSRIESAQNDVHEIGRCSTEWDNKKGPLRIKLHQIRDEIHRVNLQLQTTSRDDHKTMLALMTQSMNLNQEESRIQSEYEMVEEKTRILFDEYKAAVMKSYEVERNQSTHFKFFSLVFSGVCGGFTFLVLLIKFLTQTTEFREMQRIMDLNEQHRKEAEDQIQAQILQLKSTILQQQRTIDQIHKHTLPRKEQDKTWAGLYDWIAWACRPLKFW